MWEFSIAKYGDFTKHIDSFDKKKRGKLYMTWKVEMKKVKEAYLHCLAHHVDPWWKTRNTQAAKRKNTPITYKANIFHGWKRDSNTTVNTSGGCHTTTSFEIKREETRSECTRLRSRAGSGRASKVKQTTTPPPSAARARISDRSRRARELPRCKETPPNSSPRTAPPPKKERAREERKLVRGRAAEYAAAG